MIAIVTLSYWPAIGGTENQMKMLAERLGNTCILTRRLGVQDRFSLIEGVEVYRLWSWWVPILCWATFTFSVVKWAYKKHPEVLIATMLNSGTFAACVASRLFNIPLIIRPSSNSIDGRLDPQPLPFNLKSVFLKFMLNSAHSFVALNQEIIDELVNHGVPIDKITFIPNGVDLEYWQ